MFGRVSDRVLSRFMDFFRLRIMNSNFYATIFYDMDIEGKRL